MPNHALEVVDVDLCAPAAELAERLAALCRRDGGDRAQGAAVGL
jgi:hypothetical protein